MNAAERRRGRRARDRLLKPFSLSPERLAEFMEYNWPSQEGATPFQEKVLHNLVGREPNAHWIRKLVKVSRV